MMRTTTVKQGSGYDIQSPEFVMSRKISFDIKSV